MLFKDIIIAKRDGKTLSPKEISVFVDGLANGDLPAEQIASLAMAILLRGMSADETGLLTRAMAASGTMIDWAGVNLSGPTVDKHSTGGVGDKVSFILAPVLAACGAFVPMISGRGLGHTGGTLDKASAIPGYDPFPGLDVFKRVVRETGAAIIGQTSDLAPADRRLYAIRDVTGTVESIPLITASILSKKIAAGNQGLVMDVKVGSGAFMAGLADAKALALSIIGAAQAAGLPVTALVTDMNEVLGETAGNALEIAESVDYLRGDRREPRLHEVNLALAAEMLVISGLAASATEGREKAERALSSGAAAECFGRMVAALGGPGDFLERSQDYLPGAPVRVPVPARESGFVTAMNGRAIGGAIIGLKGGRAALDDVLDLSTGFSGIRPIGSAVEAGAPLAFVHAADDSAASRAIAEYQAAVTIGGEASAPGPTAPNPPAPNPVVHPRLDRTDFASQ